MNVVRQRPGRPGHRPTDGFTLIELVVVVAVLGALAAVAVFRVSGITDSGAASACRIEQREVNGALALYLADTGAYPSAESSIGDGGVGTGDGNGRGVGNGNGNGEAPASTDPLAALVPDYLDRVPSEQSATQGGTYDPERGIFDAAAC